VFKGLLLVMLEVNKIHDGHRALIYSPLGLITLLKELFLGEI
jgi:hypothetical protein